MLGGNISYQLPGQKGRIGQFRAFLLGLPSVWNRYLLLAVLLLVPVFFFWPVVVRFIRILARATDDRSGRRISLYHRCMSVLLAYIMLISPSGLQSLAEADTLYENITPLAWGQNGDVFTYYYDANGSMEYKLYGTYDPTADPIGIITSNPDLAYDHYEYNLQNRLSQLTKKRLEVSDTVKYITEYTYNTDGIRAESYYYETVNDGPAQNEATTKFHIDPYNHTGYAQVIEEKDGLGTVTKSYTIGDDVISQTTTTAGTQYLLYDGLGSTRQLADINGLVVVDPVYGNQSYSYDAYGVMLGGNPGTPQNPGSPATTLLYAGEQFDTDLQMYYNRARYYDQNIGRFNRMDPFAGNSQDPQSLHKYLYVYNNPVNSIDPSGLMTTAMSLNIGMAIGALIMSIIAIDMIGYLQGRASITGAYMETMQLALDYAVDGLTGVAAAIRSHSKAVQKAIEKAIDAAKSAGRAAKKLLKLKKFVFFKFMMPNIFDFNMRALSINPTWFVLNYLADPIRARANRRVVVAAYGHLRRPGYMSIDEFPYASTTQGGRGAFGEAVPIWENWVQGGYLGAFYRWRLKATPQPFLVVPVPI